MLKKEMYQKSVSECLTLIYNNQVREEAIYDMSQEKLADFVLEIFNKGILNNYLNLK